MTDKIQNGMTYSYTLHSYINLQHLVCKMCCEGGREEVAVNQTRREGVQFEF